MIRRQREIISTILNTDGFITGNKLAKVCNVSVRTIQLDIKDVNNSLEGYGIKINSIIKKGYFLDEKAKSILKENNIIRSVIDYKYISETPMTPHERQMYIISKLAIKDYISVEELTDKLFVSSSTISNDINAAKKWLKENLDLNINYSLTKGIKLNVSEKQKRNIISWILSYKLNASSLTKQWNYLFEGEISEDDARLHHIINEITKGFGYFLSGHSSQLFCFEILVAINRTQLGHFIEDDENLNDELKPVIIALSEKVHSYMKIELSKIEWLNLQEYFISKQFISGTRIENLETKEANNIVNEFLIKLKKIYNVDLSQNNTGKNKLVLYVSPMINRLKHKHCIANKIIENVSEIHQFEFKMASEISEIIYSQLNLNVSLIEISYIAIHLVSTQNIWKKKLNTIIISDYDEGIISYIKDKLVYSIKDKLKISGCYTYKEFIYDKKETFNDVDFIITTSTLADKTNIPFVQISPVMEQKDIDNLYQHINYIVGN